MTVVPPPPGGSHLGSNVVRYCKTIPVGASVTPIHAVSLGVLSLIVYLSIAVGADGLLAKYWQ